MGIEYKVNEQVSTDQFIALLKDSSLGERRPVNDRICMEGMILNSNLIVSVWDGERLIEVTRCMTDFHHACYLSDLAVRESHQKKRVGKERQRLTQSQLGPKCKLILIAAPSANAYYKRIGFIKNEGCWLLERGSCINS